MKGLLKELKHGNRVHWDTPVEPEPSEKGKAEIGKVCHSNQPDSGCAKGLSCGRLTTYPKDTEKELFNELYLRDEICYKTSICGELRLGILLLCEATKPVPLTISVIMLFATTLNLM